MRQKWLCLICILCLCLNGCSWMSGAYVSVKPHLERNVQMVTDGITAANYVQLVTALEDIIQSGTESVTIHVGQYNQAVVEDNMDRAVRYVMKSYPIGAYAVESIKYEIGTKGGKPAIAVQISYLHGRVELRSIRYVNGMEEAEAVIEEALRDCDSGVVMMVDNFKAADFEQLVTDYAETYPQLIMEIPQVAAGVYPESGLNRVVELTFTYQTSRETLRQMQSQVLPVFDGAALLVSGEGADIQKYAQLYTLLMERFDYEITTSITHTYSLLRHGVGDNRAFALVYAAMCRQAGLECMTVTGTRDGEPWCWNIVLDDSNYFHVDLLRCNQLGGFQKFTDDDMAGYVWDYSAYPECNPLPQVVEQTPPTSDGTTEEP